MSVRQTAVYPAGRVFNPPFGNGADPSDVVPEEGEVLGDPDTPAATAGAGAGAGAGAAAHVMVIELGLQLPSAPHFEKAVEPSVAQV